MEEERNTGVTIKELRQFLSKLPPEFDSFGMVNGEVAALGDSYYVRIDKPIVHLEIDEANKEFLILMKLIFSYYLFNLAIIIILGS